MGAAIAFLAKTGSDTPLPNWLQAAIVTSWVAAGAFFVVVVVSGIWYRRDHR